MTFWFPKPFVQLVVVSFETGPRVAEADDLAFLILCPPPPNSGIAGEYPSSLSYYCFKNALPSVQSWGVLTGKKILLFLGVSVCLFCMHVCMHVWPFCMSEKGTYLCACVHSSNDLRPIEECHCSLQMLPHFLSRPLLHPRHSQPGLDPSKGCHFWDLKKVSTHHAS